MKYASELPLGIVLNEQAQGQGSDGYPHVPIGGESYTGGGGSTQSTSTTTSGRPTIGGPLYLKSSALYVLCDCTLDSKVLTIVPRDRRRPSYRLALHSLLEVKLLGYLHYYENFVFELVVEDTRETLRRLFRHENSTTSLFANREKSSGRSGPPARNGAKALHPLPSALIPSRSTKSLPSLVYERHRTVSRNGNAGGEGVSIFTFKAHDVNEMFDWIEALEGLCSKMCSNSSGGFEIGGGASSSPNSQALITGVVRTPRSPLSPEKDTTSQCFSVDSRGSTPRSPLPKKGKSHPVSATAKSSSGSTGNSYASPPPTATRPIVEHPVREDSPLELPVFGQGYYQLA